MSSLAFQVLALALLLAGIGVWLWQRARWQDHRAASAAGLDQLMSLDLGVPVEQAEKRARSQRRVAALGDGRGPLRLLLLRAGLTLSPLTIALVPGLPLTLMVAGGLFGGWISALALGMLGALLIVMWVKLRIARRNRDLTHDIPLYLDNVVRMMTVGHSVQSAFQNAPAVPDTPLGLATAHASRLQAGGLEPDQALLAVGELYDSTELVLLASILRMATRFGGRADLIIARVAVFIRDREQAQQELMAQSSETRLSAWVLGLLPVSLACYIVAANPEYIGRMWSDPTGKHLLAGALVLQLLGGAVLYKLTKSLED